MILLNTAPDSIEGATTVLNKNKDKKEHLAFKMKMRVGVKLVLGIAMASNICILAFLYSVWHWDKKVSSKSTELLQIQKDLNMNLRESVTILQNRLLKLPVMLETDPGKKVLEWLRRNQTIASTKTITGRDNYRSLYNRSQRRDIANGKFIVQGSKDGIIVTKGVMDENGNFTETIHQVMLESDTPSSDVVSVKSNIEGILAQGRSGEAIRKNLQSIKSDMAEDLLLAEKSRTEMLNKLETIDLTEAILENTKQKRNSVLIVISAVTFFVNILILFFLSRVIITKPLRMVVLKLKEIAKGQGDLTQNLDSHSKDELGELAFWFNNFMHKLRSIVSGLQVQMGHLNESIRMFSFVSDDLGEKASRMHAKSKDTTASIESTSRRIDKIAKSAQNAKLKVNDVAQLSLAVSGEMDQLGDSSRDVSSAIASVASAIEEMYASLKEVTKNTGRGANVTFEATHKAAESQTTINNLKKSAEEINEVVELIKGIADQTHLLSLNAAIEAAGAGEAGKGFTIVAMEVKALSKRTAQATTTIRNKIQTMQKSTDVVIKSIIAIVEIIRETHDIMSSIAASVEQQTISVNEISKNVSSTSDFADTVSDTLQKTIQHEKDLSRELRGVSAEVHKIAGDAQDASIKTQYTRENVIKMDQAALATFEDTKRIEDQLNTLTQMYQRLHQIVIQFKTK